MAKRKLGVCAYCGKSDLLTRDHVIPRCLFPRPVPGDIPKVLVCSTCNNDAKSRDDDYLRDLLVTDANTSQHPITQALFQEKFTRAVQRDQSQLARDVLVHVRPVELVTPSGLFIRELYAFDAPEGRDKRIFGRIVRGLYQFYTGGTLPDNVDIEIQRIFDTSAFRNLVHAMNQAGAQFRKVGDGEVFCVQYLVLPDRPAASLWLLDFYQRVVILVMTDHNIA